MTFAVKMNTNSKVFRVVFETNITVNQVVGGDYEIYQGSYEVTPKTVAQTLNTKKKLLEKDVEVKAIPRYTVGNTSGGNTVYIGSALGSNSEAILGTAILGEMRL